MRLSKRATCWPDLERLVAGGRAVTRERSRSPAGSSSLTEVVPDGAGKISTALPGRPRRDAWRPRCGRVSPAAYHQGKEEPPPKRRAETDFVQADAAPR